METPLLMTPGPVMMPQEVRQALAEPMIHHRTHEFKVDLEFVLNELRKVLGTNSTALIQCASGTGGMESAIVNTLSSGDKVICLVGGKFGERWVKICNAFGLNVIEHKITWGEPFKISDVEKLIQEHPDSKALICQACETSTGVLNPFQKLGALTKDNHMITIVDAITALGTMPFEMDSWGLDIVIGGSQKAFMIPTGLTFLGVSQKALEKNSNLPNFYWNWQKEINNNQKGQTHFSSNVAYIKALKAAFIWIEKNGLKEFYQKHYKQAEATRKAGAKLGLYVYPQTPSHSLTTLHVPDGMNADEITEQMLKIHKVSIAGGQEHLKGKIIRISHMGAVSNDHLLQTLKALGETMNELGHESDIEGALKIAQDTLR